MRVTVKRTWIRRTLGAMILLTTALVAGAGSARAQGVCPVCKKFRSTRGCPVDGVAVVPVAKPVIKKPRNKPVDPRREPVVVKKPSEKPPVTVAGNKPKPKPATVATNPPKPPVPGVKPAPNPTTTPTTGAVEIKKPPIEPEKPKFSAETTNAIKSSLRAARQDVSAVQVQKDAETNITIALAQNADPNVKDIYPDDFDGDWTGETALFFAARRGNLRLLNELLKRGANVDLLNRLDENALHACAQCNPDLTVDVATRLIEDGTDYNQVNKRGETPLIAASKERNLALVAVLLTLDDVKLDAADADGWTALHWAVQRGDTAIVSALVEKKVNLNAKSNEKKTPLQMARDKGDADIVALLESAGAKEE